MLKLDLQLPETVAAEYYQAADLLNQRFRDTNAKIDAKVLMAFTLSRYDAEEVCGQFDLALRVVKTAAPGAFNPALK
jgi:hypothetical protein